MKISNHFDTSTDQIKCSCGCGQEIINEELFDILEDFRHYAGDKPIILHCVNRCKKHNAEIGGAKKSYHIIGSAGDFHIKGISIPELHKMALRYYYEVKRPIGLGLYDWGIHLDTSEKHKHERLWDMRTKK